MGDREILRDEVADLLGAMPEARNVFDITDEAMTMITAPVEMIADAVLPLIREREARAWDKGHHTFQLLGPDGCRCSAWSAHECGCGLYGSNIITPNPYRDDQAGHWVTHDEGVNGRVWDPGPCQHEWTDRGSADDRWRECWLCGKQDTE